MPFSTEIKVRGYHLDGYGHVNNARYLEFLEEARWDAYETHGDLPWLQAEQLGFVVANINISYRRPARLGDRLWVETEVTSLGEKTGMVRQIIRQAGGAVVVAEAEITFAVISFTTQRSVPFTGLLRSKLEALQAASATRLP
jgi:thioesterase-3